MYLLFTKQTEQLSAHNKILITRPGSALYLFKGIFDGFVFGIAYFWRGLIIIIGGNLAFQNRLGFTIKTIKHNSPYAKHCSKQLIQTVHGLNSRGPFENEIWKFIFRVGRGEFWRGLLSQFYYSIQVMYIVQSCIPANFFLSQRREIFIMQSVKTSKDDPTISEDF